VNVLIAVSIGFFLVMLSIVAATGYYLWVREAAAAAGESGATPEWAFDDVASPAGLPNWLRVMSELGAMLKTSEAETLKLKRELAAAGHRHELAVTIFLGLKASAVVLVPLLAAALMYSLNPDLIAIMPAVLCSVYLAYRLPDNVVRRAIERRKIKLSRGLPDLLDLLVIQVESGLSLEQALADTARDLRLAHPVLAEELGVFQLEIQAGTSRTEALRNLGERPREPEMRKLASLLIQADRFGTSIARVLRTQARYMRIRRRQKAEELAHKVGVKLIFPIFFLIMPSMFLVTAGPAVLYLLSNLGSLVGP
jgi:tight adherence protein C